MEYCNKAENQSRTLDTNPKAYRQAPISEVLQAYRNKTSGWRPDLYHTIQRASKFNNLSGIDPLPPVFQSSSDKFINVLKANNSLSFIITEPEHKIVLNTNILYDIPDAYGSTDIQIKGNGKKKTAIKHAGDDNFGELAGLLKQGTPKRIVIDIDLNYTLLSTKSEAYIASVLAHEVGTHVQPYAKILKKIIPQSVLNSNEIRSLELAHGTAHNQIDHKRLHEGYLAISWPSSLEKPSYRELISALCTTAFIGDTAAIDELWDEYEKDVARYDVKTGEPNSSQTDEQLKFYQEYEQWAAGKGGYSASKRLVLNARRHPLTALFILFCLVIAFLYWILHSDALSFKALKSFKKLPKGDDGL